MTETTALLPCPFCGGKPTVRHDGIKKPLHEISCDDCQCGTYLRQPIEEAIAAWNRRATPPALTPSDTITAAEAAHARGRDAFAVWWNAASRDERLQVIDGARHLLGALSASPVPAVPDGHVIAPAHATPAIRARMESRAIDFGIDFGKHGGDEAADEVIDAIYRAAVAQLPPAAAPSPDPQEALTVLREMTALFEMTDEAQQPGTDSYTVLKQAEMVLQGATPAAGEAPPSQPRGRSESDA